MQASALASTGRRATRGADFWRGCLAHPRRSRARSPMGTARGPAAGFWRGCVAHPRRSRARSPMGTARGPAAGFWRGCVAHPTRSRARSMSSRARTGGGRGRSGEGGCGRQAEPDRGAATARVGGPDLAAVALDDLAHDGQTEAGARLGPRSRRRGRSGRRRGAGRPASMPGPWSRTSRLGPSTTTSIGVPGGLYFTALSTRLAMARSIIRRPDGDVGSRRRAVTLIGAPGAALGAGSDGLRPARPGRPARGSSSVDAGRWPARPARSRGR